MEYLSGFRVMRFLPRHNPVVLSLERIRGQAHASAVIRLVEAAPVHICAVSVQGGEARENLQPILLSLAQGRVVLRIRIYSIEVSLDDGDQCGRRANLEQMSISLGKERF